MDDYCEVTFTGTKGGTYYTACNLVQYISDDNLVNTGSSTIYLYSSPQQSNNSYDIQISAFSYPSYYSGNTRYYITNATNISFNNRAHYYREHDMVEIVLLMCVVAVSFIRMLLPRR